MISDAEMGRRRALTRAAMAREGYDWLIATTGHPFGYYRWLTNRTGLSALLAAIAPKGDILFVSHAMQCIISRTTATAYANSPLVRSPTSCCTAMRRC